MADNTAFRDAEAVMTHLRALRQELLTTSMEPSGDRERSGLTTPQVSAVHSLLTVGPATVTELARRLNLSHSTTSGIVDRLEARGLVSREQDANDRRYTRVRVTAPVKQYRQDLSDGPYGRLTLALQGASPAQRKAVLDGLETLRALLVR
ncbi:MarR family transcriptional regulator [Lentzea sp. NPDC004782]|uniref:MarR family winged helix-turn-helix transcriptional regulator n=1 Tax=Lentzea sp. NPDC004782 TaxID=3154458 RepID=UPI0033B22D97